VDRDRDQAYRQAQHNQPGQTAYARFDNQYPQSDCQYMVEQVDAVGFIGKKVNSGLAELQKR